MAGAAEVAVVVAVAALGSVIYVVLVAVVHTQKIRGEREGGISESQKCMRDIQDL